jgi:hypothetical protein
MRNSSSFSCSPQTKTSRWGRPSILPPQPPLYSTMELHLRLLEDPQRFGAGSHRPNQGFSLSFSRQHSFFRFRAGSYGHKDLLSIKIAISQHLVTTAGQVGTITFFKSDCARAFRSISRKPSLRIFFLLTSSSRTSSSVHYLHFCSSNEPSFTTPGPTHLHRSLGSEKKESWEVE